LPGIPSAGPGLPGIPAAGSGVPAAGPGLPGAPRPDASIADTAPPRAAAPPQPVVAPLWPAPPPTEWPAPPANSSGRPDPPQNGNDLDMIPGMPAGTTVQQPYSATGADPYRPANNQTLIVSGADAPYGTTVRESWLGRQLFSRRLAYIAAGLAVVLVFG